jgi:hypothetical protein
VFRSCPSFLVVQEALPPFGGLGSAPHKKTCGQSQDSQKDRSPYKQITNRQTHQNVGRPKEAVLRVTWAEGIEAEKEA